MSKVSATQIKEWENQYGTLKVITVGEKKETKYNPKSQKDEEVVIDKGVTAYLRRIDRATIKYAMSKSFRADGAVDAISPGEIVLNKCRLGGDESLLTEDKFYFKACIEANNYLNEQTGFLDS